MKILSLFLVVGALAGAGCASDHNDAANPNGYHQNGYNNGSGNGLNNNNTVPTAPAPDGGSMNGGNGSGTRNP
jgi:hypothetical protein